MDEKRVVIFPSIITSNTTIKSTYHKGLENKQNFVKSHSLTSKLGTIKNHAM